MARPVSFIKQQFIDYSNEVSHVRLPVTTLTGANFATVTGQVSTLYTAIAALTLGNQKDTSLQANQNIGAPTPPTSPDAQREKKWLVRYHDASNRRFSVEIPCADLSKLATNSDQINPTDSAWLAFITAFEAVVVSPDDGSAVTVDGAQFVGRRL